MLGVLVNVVTAVVGGLAGTLFKKGIPEKITKSIMAAVGLCVIYIGIDGALKGENTLVLIISMLVGTVIGSLIDIDDKINRLGLWVEKKFNKGKKKVSVAEGFVTATLLFCVGSMTVVGSLNAGLLGDNRMLYTKAVLDLVSGMVIATSCGIGSLIDIDDKINRLGLWVEKKFNKGKKKVSVAEGFVTATLLFCVGSMTVVGSLNAGLLGDNRMLYTKAVLDLVSGMVIATSCGIGVAFSAVSVFVIQGGIVLLAEQLNGILTTPAINEMTCTGSVIIIALGLNLVGISKFKVANFMPAIFLAPLVYMLLNLLPFSI